MNTVPAAGPAFGMAAALLSFMYLIYLVIVAVGIWRSADRYKGKPMWAALAKAAVAAQAAGLVMRITYAVFGPAR